MWLNVQSVISCTFICWRLYQHSGSGLGVLSSIPLYVLVAGKSSLKFACLLLNSRIDLVGVRHAQRE